jgi:hypothetical protein
MLSFEKGGRGFFEQHRNFSVHPSSLSVRARLFDRCVRLRLGVAACQPNSLFGDPSLGVCAMKKTTLVDQRRGRYRILIESMEGERIVHDYGIPRMAWVRGARFLKHFGSERALNLIDQRAERAADRRDFETARRWRDLIAAIHAIEEDERLLGDQLH